MEQNWGRGQAEGDSVITIVDTMKKAGGCMGKRRGERASEGVS